MLWPYWLSVVIMGPIEYLAASFAGVRCDASIGSDHDGGNASSI